MTFWYLEDGDDYDADDEDNSHKTDSELMPPPPAPPKKTSNGQMPLDKSCSESSNLSLEEMQSSTENSLSDKPAKRLNTPLAAMLPSKYENMDVTLLFPEFRHNKVCDVAYSIHAVSNVKSLC